MSFSASDNLPWRQYDSLIAPVWHTVLLICIFLGVTLSGALFQRHAQSTSGVLQQHPNVVPLYLSLIAVEWFPVYGSGQESAFEVSV